MARMLIVCAMLVATAPNLPAAPIPQPTETVVRFTVHPMAAPKPALKYQLLPELRDMLPGNPIQAYAKCFAEQNNFFHSKEAVANREKWLTAPLESLPVKDLRDYGGAALRQADYAARLDTPDWQILLQLKKDGMHLLLPDLHPLRTLAFALKVRFRVAVAERRFEDGVKTAQTTFALSTSFRKHPTLIGYLVGVAIATTAVGPLEEMIQQPGCPNLYWALTALPHPLIDMRTPLQGERIFLAAELGMLDEREPMSEREIEKAGARIVAIAEDLVRFSDGPAPKQKRRAWLQAKVQDADYLKAARKRLAKIGLDEKQVSRFPAVQVVLLDEKREFEDRRDEATKGMLLPYWQCEAVLDEARQAKRGESLLGGAFAAFIKVRRRQAQLEQRLALLRHVEALRLHAAAHQGKLPDKLADVKVPLPVDPFSGKPFIYKKDGDKAVLQGTAPRGEEKNPIFNVRFEVVVKS